MTKPERVNCPKCEAVATNMTPLKNLDRSMAIYGCSACGYAFKADGGEFVENANQLRDVFRGATEGQKTLLESLNGEKLNPATRNLLTARLIEYGLTMWNDGLKQGILLGTIQSEKEEQS